MTYRREWRLALAADLLRESAATLAAIAAGVGFANPFALSAAFKRAHGISPSEYRKGIASAEVEGHL
jgi:AraC-like DNA-binding protein